MSYVKLMVHAVWGTKNRERILTPDVMQLLLAHMKVNAKEKNIFIDTINGQPDHIHCLFGLNADMSLAKAMNLLKGESSYWLNKENLLKKKFEWAAEYFAASVSESQLEKVRNYIVNQEEHHRILTFREEYDNFIDAYKLGNVIHS
jgi:putative transposase